MVRRWAVVALFAFALVAISNVAADDNRIGDVDVDEEDNLFEDTPEGSMVEMEDDPHEASHLL